MSSEDTKEPIDLMLSAMASGKPIDQELRTTLMQNIQDEVESIAEGDMKLELLAAVLKIMTLMQWEYHTRLVDLERWAKQVQDGVKALRDRAGDELSPEVKAHAERVREANDVS